MNAGLPGCWAGCVIPQRRPFRPCRPGAAVAREAQNLPRNPDRRKPTESTAGFATTPASGPRRDSCRRGMGDTHVRPWPLVPGSLAPTEVRMASACPELLRRHRIAAIHNAIMAIARFRNFGLLHQQPFRVGPFPLSLSLRPCANPCSDPFARQPVPYAAIFRGIPS